MQPVTEEQIRKFTLGHGRGDGKHTACLMSARALLDGRPFSDDHPSAILARIGIRLNDYDWWESDAERTAVLMPLALDERLCASKCDASREAERQRADIAVKWALSWAAPHAAECAARALQGRWPEHAEKLRDRLRANPTRELALELKEVALKARAAAAAAAAAYAYAAYAAAADDDRLKAKKVVRDALIVMYRELLAVGWKEPV